MPRSMTFDSNSEKPKRRWIPKSAIKGHGGEAQLQYSRSIGRALEVLDTFDCQSALALNEIRERTGIPQATLFRVLVTLEKHGYITQSLDGTYQIASRLWLGRLAEHANSLRNVLRPELESLARQFNETVSFAYLFDDRIHVLDSIEPFQEIRITNRIGRVVPPHCSALGKIITAHQDRAIADRIIEGYGLPRCTDSTITDRLRLFEELARIRDSGTACDREESVVGGICFAAAIRPAGKQVMAAISLSMPIDRLDPKREAALREELLSAAKRVALSLAKRNTSQESASD